MSLLERLARLFRDPHAQRGSGPPPNDPTNDSSAGGEATSDGTVPVATDGGSDAVAVVVQAPPEGVRRYELTVRVGVPVEGVDPDLLTSTFESFDEGTGAVRARAVDVDGAGRTVDAAATLFVVRFVDPVDPDTVSVDGTVDGHDEEPVPWSRIRLTPVE